MNRMMTIGVVAALMFAGGCKPKNSVPDMPEPEVVVQPIESPSDLGDTPREMEWSEVVQYFNTVVSAMSRVAANVDQMGDQASPEMKATFSDAEKQLSELRGKLISARQSGSLAELRSQIEAANTKLDAVRNMLVPPTP